MVLEKEIELAAISRSPSCVGFRLCTVLGIGLVLFLVSTSRKASAQQISVPVDATGNPKTSASDDTRYKIGPGDVLEVRVLKAPELSREEVRVDERGMIRMPMLADDIKAACLTEAELGEKIATLYLEYKRAPSVSVFVKEYQSQPVSVVGAVNNSQPQGTQFRLHRRVRLLEILTLAGGLSEKAGRTVNVVHAGGLSPCEDVASSTVATGDLGILVTYRLSDTMKGVAEANPILRPGDIVVVPEGDQVYVVGNVMKPSTIPIKDSLTVTRAIAAAGGTAQSSNKSRVRIVRQLPGGGAEKQEIYVDLSAIEKHQAVDPTLLPNDIVDVPISGTKSFIRALLGAVAPAVSQASVRVVP